MTYDAAYYEDLQGRLRGLLIEVAKELPSVTVGLVDELIDANECGVALEMISDMLVESDGRIDVLVLTDVERLVEDMGLDVSNVDVLRPLVVERDQEEEE